MPRIAEVRVPAEPSSADQRERYERILLAASRLGAEHDYERVQMHDVAKTAGVAIATLYRYFPSKAHLFTSVMRWQVQRFESTHRGAEEGDRAETIAELLLGMTREMARRPRLSLAMIQANNATGAQHAESGEQGVNDVQFERLVLETGRIDSPTEEELRRVRLVVHCWYGVLTSVLYGRIAMDAAAADIYASCALLLAPDPQPEAGSIPVVSSSATL